MGCKDGGSARPACLGGGEGRTVSLGGAAPVKCDSVGSASVGSIRLRAAGSALLELQVGGVQQVCATGEAAVGDGERCGRAAGFGYCG